MSEHRTEKDRPDIQSQIVKDMMPDLTIVRDVAGGYSRIKAERETYLPKHPKESSKNYAIRLNRPTFFNAFIRTVDGLVGMVFRRNPQLGDDVPEVIREHWENIDNQGNHGDVFLKNVFHDAMEAGHAAILVDFPKVEDPDNMTKADEQARNLRPYWVHVRKEDIRNTRFVVVNGQLMLQQVSIRFVTNEPDGEFGDEPVVRYRVYTKGIIVEEGNEPRMGVTWEVWQEDDTGEPQPTGERGTLPNVTEIPLVGVYGRYRGFFQSSPPLIDLAWLNILHYQTNSDYHHACHIGCVPMLAITGVSSDGDVEIGPNTTLQLPEGADAKWVETDGTALAHTQKVLKDLEGQEAVMGLSLLQGEKRSAETAEAKRLDKSEKDSALTTAARSLEDAVETALQFHAQHMGLDSSGSITINRDFEQQTMDAQEIQVWSQMVASGQLSVQTMWTKFKEGEILPDDFDAEVERVRLEEEMMPLPVKAEETEETEE